MVRLPRRASASKATGRSHGAPAGDAPGRGPLRGTSGRHVWGPRHQRDQRYPAFACRAGHLARPRRVAP
eukprot:175554-Chlamydomonas_euryale.AAC.1